MQESPANLNPARGALYNYLKNTYSTPDCVVISVAQKLAAVFSNEPNIDLNLLTACVESGDPKLILSIVQQLAGLKVPQAEQAMSEGKLTYHPDSNDDKAWIEYSKRNIDKATKNCIHRALSLLEFRNETFESTLPGVNCSITSKASIEKILHQLSNLLNANNNNDEVFEKLFNSININVQQSFFSISKCVLV